MHIENLFHRSHAGIPGTFQTLHKQDTHHLDQETFTVHVVIPILSRSLTSLLLIHFEIKTWLIGGKTQLIKLLINFLRGLQLTQMLYALVDIDRLLLVWEAQVFTQGILYQLSGTSHDKFVGQVEELRRQGGDESTDSSIRIVAPLGVFGLRILEEVGKRFHSEVIIVEGIILAMADEVELSLHIVQAGVDRSS